MGLVEGTTWPARRWKVMITPSPEAPNFEPKEGKRKGGGRCGEHQRMIL